MKRLLVPTDFSDTAKNALLVAAQLARKYDCEIYLLHMLELPLQYVDAIGSHSELPEAVFFMKLARKRFEDVMALTELKGIPTHEVVKFNQTFSGVIDACEENNIDLIVMGSHGISGFKEMFIGSNTEKVVRTSHIPVLVIKNHHEDFEISDFVFASDFENDSKETYAQAVTFAEKLGARVHLVIINTANKFMTTKDAHERIEKFTEGNDFNDYSLTIYNDETVERGILNFAQSINADLIGISTHGRQGIAHFLNGSISEDLVNHAQRPVITFKI